MVWMHVLSIQHSDILESCNGFIAETAQSQVGPSPSTCLYRHQSEFESRWSGARNSSTGIGFRVFESFHNEYCHFQFKSGDVDRLKIYIKTRVRKNVIYISKGPWVRYHRARPTKICLFLSFDGSFSVLLSLSGRVVSLSLHSRYAVVTGRLRLSA